MTRTPTHPTRPATMRRPMKAPIAHRPELDPAYVTELRARVEAIGFRQVARVGGMGLATLWRVLQPAADRPPTLDAIERVRAAIMKADPRGAPMPAPFVAVRGAAHAAWCALGAELDRTAGDALAAAVATPAAVRAAVRAAKPARAASPRKRR